MLATEPGPRGILVNALAPGYIKADLNGTLPPLASDAGRSVTGVVLPLDSGHVVAST